MLIVFEGLDASGKSTQINLFKNFFDTKNIKHCIIHFPRINSVFTNKANNSFFSYLIYKYLNGEFGDIQDIAPKEIALLYAVDRFLFLHDLKREIKNNDYVLLDRYVYSNIAYQCAKIDNQKEKKELKNWILKLEFQTFKLPKPNIVIYLDMPIKFIKEKITVERKKNKDKDIHEDNLTYLLKVQKEYKKLCKEKLMISIKCYNKKEILPKEIIFEKIKKILKIK